MTRGITEVRLNVNIWIDDMPEAIVGSEIIPPLETSLSVVIEHGLTGTRIVGKIDLPDVLQKTRKLIEAAGDQCTLGWCQDDYEIQTEHGIHRHYPSEPYLKVTVHDRDDLSEQELVTRITNIAGHLAVRFKNTTMRGMAKAIQNTTGAIF